MQSQVMKGNSIPQFEKSTISYFDIFASLMFFAYVLSYRPYITEWYLSTTVRIAIEAILLLLLITATLRYSSFRTDLLWLIPVIMIHCCLLLMEFHSFAKLISFFNKIAILILLIDFLTRDKRVLKFCLKLWIGLSYFLCIFAIIAFIGYATGIINFPYSYNHGYGYYINPILGNIMERRLFNFTIGQVAGFMMESVYLGSIFMFNIIMSQSLIGNIKKSSRFIKINVVAGFTTVSITFFIFFIFYYLYKNLYSFKRINIQRVLFAIISSVIIIFITFETSFFYETSGIDRIVRMHIYFEAFMNNTLTTTLFGNGIDFVGIKYGLGIDSGWFRLLIERGLVLLVYVLALLYRYTKFNHWLMFYILYYNFSISLFSFPLFYLLIALSYACYYKNKRLYTAV